MLVVSMFGRSGTAAPPKLSGIGDHANGGHGSGPNSGHGSGNGQHAGSGNGGSGRHHATNGGDDGGAGGGDGKQLVPAAGSPQHRATLLTSLASFVPQTIRRFLQQNAHLDDAAFKAPMRQDIQTVALFADVSGFTELSESLASKGPIGSEELGYYLNKHFELMGSIIGKSGGDVFKFAGDAMVCIHVPVYRVSELRLTWCVVCSSCSGLRVVSVALRSYKWRFALPK